MSRISDLDKVLDYVRNFSKDLAPIPDSEMSLNVGIEINLLVEFLEELEKRRFITYNINGSYITLQGRMALETQKMENHFRKKLKIIKSKKHGL